LSFGVTIHKTLEKYLTAMIQENSLKQGDLFGTTKAQKLEIPNKDLLQKFYEESWVDDWFSDKAQKQEYRKRGLQNLENFYTKFASQPKLPNALEKPFKLKLGEYKFVGKIDRIDNNTDGTVDIVDYKTGEPKEKLSPVDKQQLMIYQWAASEQYQLKVKSLSYWYLQSLEDSGQFLGTPEDLVKLQDKLLETVSEIIRTIETDGFLEADKKASHECKYRHLVA